MNAQQIKDNIAITDVLAFFSLFPKKIQNNKLMYLSPFRKENTPSFAVDEKKNIFFDFGEGIGGSSIDFVMKYKNISFTEAIKFMNENFSNRIEFIKKNTLDKDDSVQNQKNTKILEVKEIYNYNLKNYIQERKIDLEVAKKYLKEVHFESNGKELYGVGFSNEKNGWEIRNSFYKGNIGGKDISYIKNSDTRELCIFEGFFDFLSYLTMNQNGNKNFLILNTLAFVFPLENQLHINSDISKKVFDLIKSQNKIELFLDNDEAGNRAKKIINNIHSNVIDNSILYEKYNDLNDFLCKEKFQKSNKIKL
ncbi:CHC2 zinc finger domain-containing protein [Capnocytophaga canis]|uniref:CHC2 zinc finger domain-containing protein n=1 Tax=Capnocytophaga canis TaxID=1848903 RepID=UPI0015626967|nr:CHC2 zinc finger domain-containing protein [Capnocytophaga canis]